MLSRETAKRLTVGSVTHVGMIECESHATLGEVARLMADEDTHSVLVERKAGASSAGEPAWGIVSDIDLMRAIGAGALEGEASQAASEVVTVGINESLEGAARLMAEHECSHLVVTAGDPKRPVGVISSLDVVRGFAWGWRPTARAID